METSSINTAPTVNPLLASKTDFQAPSQVKSQEEEPKPDTSENKVNLSDEGLKLSNQLQKNAAQQLKTQISDNQEAQATINNIKIAMQNEPGRSFSAHSNFTSNMVRSLTG